MNEKIDGLKEIIIKAIGPYMVARAAPGGIIDNFIAQLNRIESVIKKWDAYSEKYYPGSQDATPLFCFMVDLGREIQSACDAFEEAIDLMTKVLHGG